jgi:hypothetical protein
VELVEAQARLQVKQLALEVRKVELHLKMEEAAKAAKMMLHQVLMGAPQPLPRSLSQMILIIIVSRS